VIVPQQANARTRVGIAAIMAIRVRRESFTKWLHIGHGAELRPHMQSDITAKEPNAPLAAQVCGRAAVSGPCLPPFACVVCQ
jgi:hypothetical protein